MRLMESLFVSVGGNILHKCQSNHHGDDEEDCKCAREREIQIV